MSAKWAIILVVGIALLHYSVMGYSGYDPSIESQTLMAISLVITYAWWILEDARKHHYHRPYEFGAFVIFAWPIVLPAYFVATRGWRGLLLFPAFATLYYLPWLMGWVFYYMNPTNQ